MDKFRELFYKVSLEKFDFVAEVDVNTGEMRVIRAEKTIGSLDLESFPLFVSQLSRIVFSEDVSVVRKKTGLSNIQKVSKGTKEDHCQFRIADTSSDSLTWYDLGVVPFNYDGRELALILIRDINLWLIHNMETKNRYLKNCAERDPLTGVYNKVAVADLVDEYIRRKGKDGRHALLLCDIDNFKLINDRFGHPFGDTILKEISSSIVSCFRSDDIVGRIGGDEFVVFVDNIPRREYIASAAQKFCESAHSTIKMSGGNVTTSASIGIAIYPDDGENFQSLYNNADWAMYSVKASGKNGYRFYDEAVCDSDVFVMKNTSITSEREQRRSKQVHISDHMFNILFDSKDLDSSVAKVLKLLGGYFDLSRIYVFLNEAGHSLRQAYHWEAEGVSPIDAPRKSAVLMRRRLENAVKNNHSIMYCRDITKAPEDLIALFDSCGDDAKAFMHCSIVRGTHLCGFVGFEDCRRVRVWTEDESRKLIYLCKLLRLLL
ncbi:MAG: diguanylate cyclase, partial [Clostridia bacterium]|nr:diguanylate cyclase [Clostridia bacterium]